MYSCVYIYNLTLLQKVKLYIIHFVPEVEVVLFRLSLAAVKIQTLTVSKKVGVLLFNDHKTEE